MASLIHYCVSMFAASAPLFHTVYGRSFQAEARYLGLTRFKPFTTD